MPRNPTNRKGILSLLRGISDEALDTWKESGGKIVTECEVEIRGRYLTDKNGEIQVAVEATADPTKVVSTAVEAKAKTGGKWFKKSALDWDGALLIRWTLRPARQTVSTNRTLYGSTEKEETDLTSDEVEVADG